MQNNFGAKDQVQYLGGYRLTFFEGQLSAYKQGCLVFRGEPERVASLTYEQVVYESAFENPPRVAAYFSREGIRPNQLWKDVPDATTELAIADLHGTPVGCTVQGSWLFLKDSVLGSEEFVLTAFSLSPQLV
jgi:hypothetical protein